MAWAELTDSRCYYDVRGRGDPLLLVPGLGATCESWRNLTDALGQHFSVIQFDNRGTGESEAKRSPTTLADLSSDIVELLDHLQLERVHVLGLSLGGIIAQRLAMDHPSRIDRLVLVSCADAFTPYLREVAKLLGQALRHFPPDAFVRTMELLSVSPEYLDANPAIVEERIKDQCRKRIPKLVLARQLRCLACSDVEEKDYHIPAPTLVIAGEYDGLIPMCYSRRMSERIAGSQFMLVNSAGHNPLVECPERVLPRIVQFLSDGRYRAEDVAHDESDQHGEALVEA